MAQRVRGFGTTLLPCAYATRERPALTCFPHCKLRERFPPSSVDTKPVSRLYLSEIIHWIYTVIHPSFWLSSLGSLTPYGDLSTCFKVFKTLYKKTFIPSEIKVTVKAIWSLAYSVQGSQEVCWDAVQPEGVVAGCAVVRPPHFSLRTHQPRQWDIRTGQLVTSLVAGLHKCFRY